MLFTRIALTLSLAIMKLQALEITFESIEHIAGFDIFTSTLRVRKYNRTTTTLNGTLSLRTTIDNNFTVRTELYHSSLGNQQYNHYPMKLPTQRLCDFVTSLHDEYGAHITAIRNIPKKGECPIAPREVFIRDMEFPSKAVPPFFPKGLWKVFIIDTLYNVEVVRFEMILKVYSDSFL